MGGTNLSIMKMVMAVAKRLKTANEPAGIMNCGPRCLSIVRAWSMKRLVEIPIGVPKNIPVDHSGMIFIRVLRSSTSLTVHSFHDLAYEPSNCLSVSIFSAAQFKSLHKKMVYNNAASFCYRIN